ncbi:MAG: N-acetylmuramoyl-L-alanine amidase, partial [Ignavibacteriae bacterium]|nr:N-acetylmuramoyl-L-alanine amidase [Ignavibacteriota bacterium]
AVICTLFVSANVNAQDTASVYNGSTAKNTIKFKEIRSICPEKNSDFIVILDPAHGYDVPGKRSPDARFQEWKWSREIIRLISDRFDSLGISYALDNDSDAEIGLKNRVRNTNKISQDYHYNRAIFISVHANASGMGTEWLNAGGFSIYTSRGHTPADVYAGIIYDEFKKTFPELKTREDYSDGDTDFEANFRVLLCRVAAVLIGTMFQDNREDVEIMLSEEFKTRYAEMITNAVIAIISLGVP